MSVGDIRSQLDNLREDRMVKLGFKILLAIFFVGVAAMISPYVFAVIPFSESTSCFCGF